MYTVQDSRGSCKSRKPGTPISAELAGIVAERDVHFCTVYTIAEAPATGRKLSDSRRASVRKQACKSLDTANSSRSGSREVRHKWQYRDTIQQHNCRVSLKQQQGGILATAGAPSRSAGMPNNSKLNSKQ
jgi:hypothetical protein